VPEGARHVAKRAFCGLFELVLPDDCRVCGEPLHEVSRIPVCSGCLREPAPLMAEFYCVACRTPFLNRFPLDETGRCALCRLGVSGFDAVYSYGSYEGALRKLIHLFKYGGVQPLARVFGNWMAIALPREQQFDLIVPMPLHWLRRWQRRYNQAGLLAREVSRRWNVPVKSAVKRRRATAPQAGLTNSKRRLNVSGAFVAKTRLDGLHVLLVDDVLTTGASAAACARALKRAGARRVTVLALARTDRRASLSYQLESEAAAIPAVAGSSNP
jgi:ComF family protein